MSNEFVSEAIVVGIPDEIRGESIVCYIVPIDNSIDTQGLSDQLIKLIEKNIGKFAKPKQIRFVKDLPRTKTGKLLRRLIKLKVLNIEISDKDLSLVENPESIKNMLVQLFVLTIAKRTKMARKVNPILLQANGLASTLKRFSKKIKEQLNSK